MGTQITVPPLPKGTKGWRKVITGLDPSKKDGYAVEGPFVRGGDVVSVPTGTLIIGVDKAFTGRRATRYGVSDTYSATVTIYVAASGGLTEVWTRHYKQAKSAFGATTKRKLAALLAEYPPPQPGPPVVVTVKEAQRPNRREAQCRWCHATVSSWCGHIVGHGDDIEVEHWQSCPTKPASDGEPCELCGVTVRSAIAHQVLLRDGEGRWQTRHLPSENCTRRAVMSWEEYQKLDRAMIAQQRANAEEQRKAKERQERTRQRRLAAQLAREKTARAAHDAEQARIAGLETTSWDTVEVANKGIGHGRRARLLKRVDTLEDGTTTVRWTVEQYATGDGSTGEDGDPYYEESEYTWEPDARAAYKSLRYESVPSRPEPGGTCDNCGRGGAQHRKRDSSGIEGVVCLRCYHDVPSEEMSFA